MSSDHAPPEENPYRSPDPAASEASPEETPLEATVVTKPRVWTVFSVCVLSFLCVIAAQIVYVVVLLMKISMVDGVSIQEGAGTLVPLIMRPDIFLGLMIMNQIVILVSALIPAFFSNVPLKERLGWHSPNISISDYLVLTFGSGVPFTIGIGAAVALSWVVAPDESVRELYKQMTPGWSLPFLLVIALAPGVCEELLFRGYIQRRLLERWSPAVAIGVTSILFGLFHVSLHQGVFAAILGVYLGVLAWRTNSIFPSIVCHAAVNGIWNMWQLCNQFDLPPSKYPIAVATVFGIVATIAFVQTLGILNIWPRRSE